MAKTSRTRVDAILLLYHHSLVPNAATIMEHVNALRESSRFAVCAVNTELGMPKSLEHVEFPVIILHYSLFGTANYMLSPVFREYLDRSQDSYKVAFFQDEYHNCRLRFDFLTHHRVNAIYTLVDPEYWPLTYGKYVPGAELVYTLTGYVSDTLVRTARRLAKPDAQRMIDIGYRGRELPLYMGRGAREKTEIAREFARRTEGSGLVVDVATKENERLYGRYWHEFMASCRGVIGVEAGVSIFDIEDVVQPEFERLVAENPDITAEELGARLLDQWEGNIPYRTISPRHFEAAAFRAVQVLFEGRYSGIMEAGRHYIPLRKDYSNFDEVMRIFRDPRERERIASAAYDDLIGSGRYSYQSFVRDFDDRLERAIPPGTVRRRDVVRPLLFHRLEREQLVALAAAQHRARWAARYGRFRYHATVEYQKLRNAGFPGRALLKSVYRWLVPLRTPPQS